MDELLVAFAPAGDTTGWQLSSYAHYNFFDVDLTIGSDDPSFINEFESVFGRGLPGDGSRASIKLTLRGDELHFAGDPLENPAAFLAGFSSPDIPLTLDGENGVRVGDDPQPMFVFDGDRVRVRKIDAWRRIVSHMLFLRLIRRRSDLLFFHAASIGIGGRAFLLIGPKGRGKTSVSLALASRGHSFLGDETAIVEPATMLVHPFHRPVGIKRGPCASRVAEALADAQFPAEGILRTPIVNLLSIEESSPLPLGGVFFLQSFEETTRIEPVTAGRDELSQMQPLASSFAAGTAAQRVFAMVRLLGSTRCYKLWPSQPDSTAIDLEKALAP